MSFQRFVLTDVDEKYAPPEKPVLDITVIDSTAFLRIGTQPKDDGSIKEIGQVAVPVDDLYDALGAAWRGDVRARLRPKAEQ